MLNCKCLELVLFPKELLTHTDASFDGSHTASEGPCLGMYQFFWLMDLAASPCLPASFVQKCLVKKLGSHRALPLNLTQIFFLDL